MDWTKAKNILIAALLVTNLLFLASMFYGNAKVNSENALFLENTIAVLHERNINIEGELRAKQISMPVLSVEYDNADPALIKALIASQKSLPGSSWSETAIREMAEAFLAKCGLMTENVRYDGIQKNSGLYNIHYSDTINGIAIEDSYMNCSIKDGKVQAVSRLWLKPVDFGKTKKQVIPIALALIKFMTDHPGGEKVTIQKIELVYWLDAVNFGLESPVSDTAFPSWKISYNYGQVSHINAFEQ